MDRLGRINLEQHNYIATDNGISLLYENGRTIIIQYYAPWSQWKAVVVYATMRVSIIDWANDKDSWWFNN